MRRERRKRRRIPRSRLWGGFALVSLVLGGLGATVARAQQKKDSCLECHAALEGPLADPVTLMKEDIHRARGFSCADCHGGDPTSDDPLAAMDPRKGFVARPPHRAIPALCGRCHSDAEFMKRYHPALRVDQEREYFTSVHGKRLRAGDTRVATCTSCHGAHGIRSVQHPLSPVYPLNVAETCARCHADAEYMAAYRLPHDQYNRYRRSAHARALYDRQDLSAPTCNDCHGNHGAVPPGIASVAHVCGQCHVRQSALFRASPHKAAFDAMQLAECVYCHGNHDVLPPTDEMIGTGEKSVCVSCHPPGDAGYQAAERMRALIDDLSRELERAQAILDRAERAGMEVSRAKFELSEARDALTHARVLIHAFSVKEVENVIRPGLEVARRGYQAGERALAELNYRRKGLAVSLLFLLFLAALLYLKLREIEGPK
ncbi:hypothetical protein HRbin08_00153 [bacterium HR08]|nr:hypothetical protein HRbin08_00153 [bacterium HR08]